jgi:GNAT superfamily N-acetyltransferase
LAYTQPRLLAPEDNLVGFRCGEPSLDRWLATRARSNQAAGFARTYATTAHGRVVGFYSLSASNVARSTAPGALRRNSPDPIPVILLGRLAVDVEHQGRGLGSQLLRDALARSARAATVVGVRALLVHAASADAAGFYTSFGFVASAVAPATLFLPMERIAASVPR